jgi:hypothetical protein
LARWASFDLACSSARKSETARAAPELDGNFAFRKPAPGRASSASKAPRGSAAIAVIELWDGPNPNLCRASAAASFPGVSKEIPPAKADPTNQWTNLLWRNLQREPPELCSFANRPFIKQSEWRAMACGPSQARRRTGDEANDGEEAREPSTPIRLAIRRIAS